MDVRSELKRAQLENRTADPSDPQDGQTYWSGSLGKIKIYNKLASAWNVINNAVDYIANSGGDSAITGYAAYADAAGSSPVDGVGGAPTTTITRTTSAPLRGGASLLVTKDAADRQGEGVSYDFLIDNADKSQQLSVAFDFETAGTFVTGGSSDVQVFLYDVVNTAFIALSTTTIDTATGRFSATFTADSVSTSYRLIFHIATTSTSAWTLKFDRVTVSPDLVINQAVSTLPAGTMVDYGGALAPSGFLFCNGVNVSRSTYASLFAAISTNFGVGDGSTTFGLPDLRGRVTVGKDDAGVAVPANTLWHANFSAGTFDADFVTTPSTETVLSLAPASAAAKPNIQMFGGSNMINLPDVGIGNGDAIATWDGTGNAPKDIGTVQFIYAGNTGMGSGGVEIRSAGTSILKVELQEFPVGFMRIGVTILGTVFTTHTIIDSTIPFVAAQKYIIQVGFDTTTRALYLFVDGVLKAGSATEIPSAGVQLVPDEIRINTFTGSNNTGKDAYIDDVTLFSTVQNTGSYTPGATEFTASPAGRMTTAGSGVDGETLGAAGGLQTYALTETELFNHTHVINNEAAHDHLLDDGVMKFDQNNTFLTGTPGAGQSNVTGLIDGGTAFSTATNGSHAHGGATASTGSSSAHQNTQPTQIVNKIIKT